MGAIVSGARRGNLSLPLLPWQRRVDREAEEEKTAATLLFSGARRKYWKNVLSFKMARFHGVIGQQGVGEA